MNARGFERGGAQTPGAAGAAAALPGPGKATLTERLPASSGGSALAPAVRADMERAFGADFSTVRIHQDGSAGAIGAHAFTRGDDIHFAPGAYRPDDPAGRELLGHELAHVVQQRQGRVQVQAKGLPVNNDAGLEAEADHHGARAARGERIVGGSTPASAPAGGAIQAKWVTLPQPMWHSAAYWEPEDGVLKTDVPLPFGVVEVGKPSRGFLIAMHRDMAESYQHMPALDDLLVQLGYEPTVPRAAAGQGSGHAPAPSLSVSVSPATPLPMSASHAPASASHAPASASHAPAKLAAASPLEPAQIEPAFRAAITALNARDYRTAIAGLERVDATLTPLPAAQVAELQIDPMRVSQELRRMLAGYARYHDLLLAHLAADSPAVLAALTAELDRQRAPARPPAAAAARPKASAPPPPPSSASPQHDSAPSASVASVAETPMAMAGMSPAAEPDVSSSAPSAAPPKASAKAGKKAPASALPSGEEAQRILEIFTKFRATLPPGFLRDYVHDLLAVTIQEAELERIARYRREPLPFAADEELVRLYCELATERFELAHKRDHDPYGPAQAKLESAAGKPKGAKASASPGGASSSREAAPVAAPEPELALKLRLLEQLGVTPDTRVVKLSVGELLQQHLHRRADRIADLFRRDPGLLDDCLRQVHEVEIHALLRDMLASNAPHSIQDMDDYLGDKVSDPLMRWIVRRGIAVEIHATSMLASMAKLASEGFTDTIEIPSTHTGTKKLIAHNPKTGMAKVVVQSLPGKSYAVQTSGAFLFYEMYNFDPSLPKKVMPEADAPFAVPGYRARNVMAHDQRVARYVLIGAKGAAMVAEVPCAQAKPWRIDVDGAIVLPPGFHSSIQCADLEIQRMPPAQLSVFEQDLDYPALYADTLRSHGIEHADIATIGNAGQLLKELAANARRDPGRAKIKPSVTIDLPYFSVNVLHINDKVLLAFPISPQFFGNKAGFLVTALHQLGVRDVIFTGKGGGLEADAQVGDILFPRAFGDASDGRVRPVGGVINHAVGIMQRLPADDKVKLSGMHVGVDSAITESAEMIQYLQRTGVSSVDCEAGFIASAIRKTGINLYHCMRLSDVPNTQASIGMGGTTGEEPAAPGAHRVDQFQIVCESLKRIIGGKLTQGAAEVAAQRYAIDAKNMIRGLKTPDAQALSLVFDIVLPFVDKDDYVGEKAQILALFGREVSAVLEARNGVADLVTMQQVQALAQKFYATYKIKIEVRYSV